MNAEQFRNMKALIKSELSEDIVEKLELIDEEVDKLKMRLKKLEKLLIENDRMDCEKAG